MNDIRKSVVGFQVRIRPTPPRKPLSPHRRIDQNRCFVAMYLSELYRLHKVMLLSKYCYFHNQHIQIICPSKCSIRGCCPEEDCVSIPKSSQAVDHRTEFQSRLWFLEYYRGVPKTSQPQGKLQLQLTVTCILHTLGNAILLCKFVLLLWLIFVKLC